MLEGRGFTYLHVAQYFYTLVQMHHPRPNPHTFPVEIGRSGDGLIINPETDILSLTQLLVSALPQTQDNRNIGQKAAQRNGWQHGGTHAQPRRRGLCWGQKRIPGLETRHMVQPIR